MHDCLKQKQLWKAATVKGLHPTPSDGTSTGDGVSRAAVWRQLIIPQMALKASAAASSYATFSGAKPTAAHPQDHAWCVSRLFLGWVTPLMALGQTKQLNMDDIWPLRKQHQADLLSLQFSSHFQRNDSVARSFFCMFGLRFTLTGVAFLLSMLMNLVGPVVLNHVVSTLTTQSTAQFSLDSIACWVLALFLAQVVQALADTYASFESQLIAIQFTACLKTMLYRKALRLSAESRKEKSMGAITNIYTVDCDALPLAAYLVHQAWLIPLQICVVSFMLYRVLGVAAFTGVGVIICTLCLNQLVSKRIFRFTRVYRGSKDARMKKVTEVFKAINIVKFNAWEDKFIERIDESRSLELRNLLAMRYMTCASIVLLWGMPVFISMVSFGTFAVVLHHELTPAIVFTSIALFRLIQGPMRQVATTITTLIQAKVSLERVTSFLDMPELNPDNVRTIYHPCAQDYIDKNVIVSIENGEFGWDDQTVILRDVNLQVRAGDFYVLHGTVGCGKSSLCSALLGEMVKRSGQVYVGGTVAYCSQQPWIQNMTVRENILFGLPYDHRKYQKVIDACALGVDLETFPAGEHTEIGERGLNLSGGQKARIALARACYNDASIYILDSPLSAVDAIVQNEIFQKCLLGLLRHKTVILVTHSPEIIMSKHITHAITVNDVGTLVETHRTEGRDLSYLPIVSPLAAHVYIPKQYTEVKLEDVVEADPDENALNEIRQEIALASPYKEPGIEYFGPDESLGKLVAEEGRAKGRVGGHVLASYYYAVGGFWVVFVIIVSQALWQGLQIGSDFWLSKWSSDSVVNQENTRSTEYRLSVYSALGLASASMVALRTLMITFFGLQAAKNMFDRMTKSLMHAPMRFFDTNPIGRILARYGGDISAVDTQIPFMFGTFFTNIFSVGCSTLTAAIVIRWNSLLLLPVVFLYVKICSFYVESAREIQRLSKTVQAPVLTHLSESIDGGVVVRAFGADQVCRFHAMNNDRLDDSNRMWFARMCVSKWLSMYIQLLGSVLLLVIASSLVLLRNQLSVAMIGLAFSYGLKVSQNLESIVRVLSRMETSMVSPERVQEYIDIPQEPPHKLPAMDPPTHSVWPSAGAIEFKNVSFRYKENDRLVLSDVDFSIEGGQKIGIVGRTGAGKSSLTMALFRINELASGMITIDDIDTSTIGIKTLREKLSIIPQNPVLFKGPLRHYLDPFDEFTDEQLWASVRQVGLTERIGQEEKKLGCIIEENGENFSVGERQMLCMTQALLRQTRIVVFDEATAAIDHETDKALQKIIRTAFASSTVITIAHRLDTILDSDMILVLDDGRVVEFASPKELVRKGSGHFFDLMQEGGYLDRFMANSNIAD